MSQWMKVGREQGEEGLRGKIAAGQQARLTQEQLEQLPGLLVESYARRPGRADVLSSPTGSEPFGHSTQLD